MAMATMSLSEQNAQRAEQEHLITGKRRRQIREALTGYIFVLPAAVATFLFGLWPVVAGFYESLKSGSPLTNKYVGLGNYVRSFGSLTYILLFALCLIFIYGSYRSWRGAYVRHQQTGDNIWPFVVPGFLFGASLIIFGFNFVTGSEAYSWAPVVLLLLSIGGYYTADRLQRPPDEWSWAGIRQAWLWVVVLGVVWIAGPYVVPDGTLHTPGWIVLLGVLAWAGYRLLLRLARMRSGPQVSATIMMGTLMLLAILLGIYTIEQLEEDVAEAREVSALIFNQQVLDATATLVDDDARIRGLVMNEEFIVEVRVGGETIEAPLAPDAFSELNIDKITALETALVNNQKINVVLPDGTIAEGELTGIPMGEQLPLTLDTEDPQAVRETPIYSALNVGQNVIRANGHTEPVSKQIYGALAVFIGIATVYTMTWVRRRVDDDEHPRIHDWLHIGRVAMGVAVALVFFYLIGAIELYDQAASGMAALTEDQFKRAYEFATGNPPRSNLRTDILRAELLYWPQVLMVAVGSFLIGVAYLVWQGAQKRETPLGFGLTITLAAALMVGGWLMISEIPRTIGLAGREGGDTLDALTRTAMYSVGTVPVQLGLGLFLAYLLFSEISWGKSIYRVIYFMPYIAPSVATSTVFLVIFSPYPNSLANKALGLFGVDAWTWLKEPNGIVRIFYESVLGGNPLNIPEGLAGPSLALFTVILYNIWVFAGYNTVVFLAGLGAIPTELYEAAEVDGAGRWSRFRNITLPLLSPTTFFLSMLSIIGTFKAFSHIYVLRSQATGKEIDTMSVHIFNQLYSANDPGYAAALAFSLFGVILVLTLVQNRLAREQVFYG
jgi:multiple sugar transport system permease protein